MLKHAHILASPVPCAMGGTEVLASQQLAELLMDPLLEASPASWHCQGLQSSARAKEGPCLSLPGCQQLQVGGHRGAHRPALPSQLLDSAGPRVVCIIIGAMAATESECQDDFAWHSMLFFAVGEPVHATSAIKNTWVAFESSLFGRGSRE